MPPICEKVKYLLYLSMGTNFFDSVSMEFMVIVMTDWCLELLLGMNYHVSCLACILPFNPGWNRHITVAVWQMRATPEHKAQRRFLVKTRAQGLAPRLLALSVVSSQPPSLRLISFRSSRLLSLGCLLWWCCPSFFPRVLCCLSGVPQQPWAGHPTLAPTGSWRNRTWMSKNQFLPGGNSYMTFISKELCVDSLSILPNWWPRVWVSPKVFSHPLPSRRAL